MNVLALLLVVCLFSCEVDASNSSSGLSIQGEYDTCRAERKKQVELCQAEVAISMVYNISVCATHSTRAQCVEQFQNKLHPTEHDCHKLHPMEQCGLLYDKMRKEEAEYEANATSWSWPWW